MPELINDWDPDKGVVVRWVTKCTRCRQAVKSDTTKTPEGWKEDSSPGPDGRIRGQCPDCSR